MTDWAKKIDAHVGARLRLYRTLEGMSQFALGEAIGLTFQQVQKYERGDNRIGAGRLYKISKILNIPVSFFFDGLTEKSGTTKNALHPDEVKALQRRETLELTKAYHAISDPEARRSILRLIQTIGQDLESDKGNGSL